MCCCLSGEPVESKNAYIQTRQGSQMFQTNMMNAPCHGGCGTCCWFLGQCGPLCCCTQCLLRRKVLEYDMTKYVCCQGYFPGCCCFKPGSCGESSCPDCCLCIESTLCNSCALSASRLYVMDKYSLSSDPCDYRLIQFNNMLQCLSCICDILAICIEELRLLARILDLIAAIVYHCVSGCMTAQTAYEQDYQLKMRAQGGGAAQGQSYPVTQQPVKY